MTERPRNRFILWAVGAGVAALVLPGMVFALGVVAPERVTVPFMLGALATSAALIALACGFAVAAASPPASSPGTLAARLAIIALAFIAPAAVVVAVRLGFTTCSGVNPLGLPWPPLVETVVQIACIALVVLSTAGIVIGFTRPALRGAATVMLIASAFAIVPVVIVIFWTIYGTPYPGCVEF